MIRCRFWMGYQPRLDNFNQILSVVRLEEDRLEPYINESALTATFTSRLDKNSKGRSPSLDLIFAARCWGKSIRFATAITKSCESRIAGQLKKLYTTSCFDVRS